MYYLWMCPVALDRLGAAAVAVLAGRGGVEDLVALFLGKDNNVLPVVLVAGGPAAVAGLALLKVVLIPVAAGW